MAFEITKTFIDVFKSLCIIGGKDRLIKGDSYVLFKEDNIKATCGNILCMYRPSNTTFPTSFAPSKSSLISKLETGKYDVAVTPSGANTTFTGKNYKSSIPNIEFFEYNDQNRSKSKVDFKVPDSSQFASLYNIKDDPTKILSKFYIDKETIMDITKKQADYNQGASANEQYFKVFKCGDNLKFKVEHRDNHEMCIESNLAEGGVLNHNGEMKLDIPFITLYKDDYDLTVVVRDVCGVPSKMTILEAKNANLIYLLFNSTDNIKKALSEGLSNDLTKFESDESLGFEDDEL